MQALCKLCISDAPIERFRCGEYLAGVSDALRFAGTGTQLPQMPADARRALAQMGICNADYTYGSLIQLFINWAQKNPQKWTEHRSFGALDALREQWPCK